MWSNPKVIDQYIDQEIHRLLDQESDLTKSHLSDCAKRVFHGQLSLDDAYQVFQAHPSGIPLLKEIQLILEMSDSPLPELTESSPSLKPNRRKSLPWTNTEDLRLLVAVARFGAQDWRWISSYLGAGRSSSQCNQRWCRAIDPSISHRPWQSEEDQKLLRAVEVLGRANWCQVAKIVSGRTDLQCRYRYLQLAKRTEVVAEADETAVVEPAKISQSDSPKKRRNSISIAPFTDLDSLKASPLVPMLPYYLGSSLEPRNDPTQQYLHRVPPLLFPRKPKPEKK
jgi:hypothetical protein